MKNKRLPLYVADLQDTIDGLQGISIVKNPASGYKWKVLERHDTYIKVFAVVLPANTPIYRRDREIGEYNVLFTPDLIKDLMEDAARKRIRYDVEHNGRAVDGVFPAESFQIDYTNRKLYDGYPGLTDGSWCAIFLLDKSLPSKWAKWDRWNDPNENGNMVNDKDASVFRSEDFFGISISGIFTYHEVSLSDAIELYNSIRF